ncbi:amino acid transporter [Lojkania enalia]|uniref:Amino acid transporter n=1 Tax=Lojkania enalia TaxID=147567 RepID=A0A9P4K7E9_9PLEO|nr:amino acid transporter [Didymosphaeria enalia]
MAAKDVEYDISSQTANDGLDLPEEERMYLEALRSKDKVATRTTRHPLGTFSVIAFILQRVIGTGIFRSPWTAIHGTQSVGITLIFWFCGALAITATTLMYIEFGLTLPRHMIDGHMTSVFRNGGDLNYIGYLIKRPRFFVLCIYGISFIILASNAANSLSFGDHLTHSFGIENSTTRDNVARGLAMISVTLACVIHAFTRRGGIIFNNILAVTKVLILLTFPIMAICALAGVSDTNYAKINMDPAYSFQDSHSDLYGYSNSFISVLYAYNGISQANFILSEIKQPRRTFPKAICTAAGLIISLYLLVNISYMIVVSRYQQLQSLDSSGVALQFLVNMLGEKHGPKVLTGFTAVSNLGNIIGMTFTASRVKQEIAKEGILPFAKFFGENRSPFRRRRFSASADIAQGKDEYEPTPVGALFLHWLFAMILILATWAAEPGTAYRILVNVFTYVIEVFFGFILGVGLLCLHIFTNWNKKSPLPRWLGISTACVVTIMNGFPLITVWFPPSDNVPEHVKEIIPNTPWYLTGLVSWMLLACGVIYWLGFRYILPRIGARKGKEFVVEREPVFRTQNGERVQWHEIVLHSWVVKREPERRSTYVFNTV